MTSGHRLHFRHPVESPAELCNFVRLGLHNSRLKKEKRGLGEWAATWHDVFDCANGEQLFLQFMEELFPDGCTIGEKELNRITDRAVRYLQTETRCLDLKAGHDKSRFTYWVSFIPEHKVYGCEFARHEETIIEILTAFFGKSIAGYSLDTLKHFILRSFEIRSDNSSVRSIAEDVDFIQRAVFARSFGNGKQEVPDHEMGCAYLCSGVDFSGVGGVNRNPRHRKSEGALVLFDSGMYSALAIMMAMRERKNEVLR